MKHFLFVSCLFISIGTFSQVDADSRLYEAIDNNDLPNVKTSLADGARINGWDDSFDSPLMNAVENGNFEIALFLLESGAMDHKAVSRAVELENENMTKFLIDHKCTIGEAVVFAAEKNNLRLVKLLVENGANVDFSHKRKTGFFRKEYISPINEAVSFNNTEMVRLLVKYGVPLKTAITAGLKYGRNDMVLDLSAQFEDKGWILLNAFERDNSPLVEQLIANGVPVNSEDENGNTLMLVAASKGTVGAIKQMVEGYKLDLFKKNKFGENALMLAAKSGGALACEYLIEKGIPVDAENNKGETALFYALSNNSRTSFELLIKKGAKLDHVSSEGNSLLLKAAIEDNQTTMYYLLSIGANIHLKNKLNYTAFDYVVEKSSDIFNRHDEIENAFIEAGADINSKGLTGNSLLFRAIEDRKLERIRYLVLKGADANTKNTKGQRPNCFEAETIKFLIEQGADINATDHRNNTFLCDAIDANDLELALFLVNKGIDVNKKCYFDEQALVIAVEEQNLTLVKFLVENGADPNAEGYMNQRIMDYAVKKGTPEIIDYLKSYGALTKEEENEQRAIATKVESEIKSALIAEDLDAIVLLMANEDTVVLQEKVLRDLAYVAAKKGHLLMINKLLSDHVEFELNSPVTNKGQTILFIATKYAQNELINTLLAKGANPYFEDENGNIAENFAVNRSTKKIFKEWHKHNW